jgi:hypothetical protein
MMRTAVDRAAAPMAGLRPASRRPISMLPLLLLLLLVLSAAPSAADWIVLKDGSRIEAREIRQENGLIRFSLPGYDGILITYSMDIVERIEKDGEQRSAKPPAAAEKGAQQQAAGPARNAAPLPAEAPPSPKPSTGKVPAPAAGGVPPEKRAAAPVPETKNAPQNPGAATAEPQPQVQAEELEKIAQVAGIEFYNPRRRFKYQTDANKGFHSFQEAVEDLAARFERPVDWVVENLGDTNDLGVIYRNLGRSNGPSGAPEAAQPVDENDRIAFYDPRRSYKYWTSVEDRFRTLDEALKSLSQQYGRPPEWIKDHLGEANNLTQLHQNLAAALAAEGDGGSGPEP